MRGSEMPRLWLLRLAQMPLAYSAPHDCLQYHTHNNGTIKTFNYAYNGRHLSRHEYRACVRRNTGYCSVRYTPCDDRSFRIGPGGDRAGAVDPTATQMEEDGMMPADEEAGVQEDETEGSGADPNIATPIQSAPANPGVLSRIWSFIWPSWMWGQRGFRGRGWLDDYEWDDSDNGWPDNDSQKDNKQKGQAPTKSGHKSSRRWSGNQEASKTWKWMHWSPYAQHYTQEDDKIRYYGYGKYGDGFRGYGRQRCRDRITIPCENEYFVSNTFNAPGVCDPHHCGSSFCPGVKFDQCRVETSISPFAVSVHFGPPTPKMSPEDNIGACLRYTQLPCDS